MDRSFFKNLETERLFLKNITPDDAEFFFQVYSDPRINEYLFDEEPMQSVDEAMKWINIYNNDQIYHNRWIIISKQTGLRMGTCGFYSWDYRNKRVEIGYELLPEYWGKGYMHEALGQAVHFAFTAMNVHKISANVYVENARSIKVLKRLGFKKEGLLKDRYFFHGRYYDHLLFSLINNESH